MKEYTLIGIDGNAYVIMGYVQRIMRQEGFSWEEIDAYHERATSGDYSHLLCESMNVVELCNKKHKKNHKKEKKL